MAASLMEQQDRTARLKRAACRCRVQVVCHEHTCIAAVARRCICVYHTSRSRTHAGRRCLPVALEAVCLCSCQGSVGVTDG
jgi:hypothetical protein